MGITQFKTADSTLLELIQKIEDISISTSRPWLASGEDVWHSTNHRSGAGPLYPVNVLNVHVHTVTAPATLHFPSVSSYNYVDLSSPTSFSLLRSSNCASPGSLCPSTYRGPGPTADDRTPHFEPPFWRLPYPLRGAHLSPPSPRPRRERRTRRGDSNHARSTHVQVISAGSRVLYDPRTHNVGCS